MTQNEPLDLEELADSIFNAILNIYGHARGEFKNKLKQELKQRIKSACEFYLRYKDKPELLIKEHPEYEEEIDDIKKYSDKAFFREEDIQKYNEWLFKLAFKGVFENVRKE